jgi:hypothetical protein
MIMENQTAIQVAKWLVAREHISTATPVIVQIGRRTYAAAKYIASHNGADEERLYLVAEPPPLHTRRRICYQTDADVEETWHLLAWQRTTCTEWQEVHFGNSHFVLARFSSLHTWAADQCGRRPYRRVPMTIVEVGPPISDIKQPTEEKHDDRG